MEEIIFTTYNSPIGELFIGGKENKINFIYHQNNIKERLKGVKYTLDDEAFDQVKNELDAYFNGELTSFSIKYDLNGTEFQKKVWEKLTQLPYGEKKSYKELAEMIGHPKAYRAVGGALNKNPLLIIVPCHRIVGSNGSLTGFAGGPDTKQYLLKLERTIE